MAERTDANVATARTSVPTPVASDETVVQVVANGSSIALLLEYGGGAALLTGGGETIIGA